MHTEIVPENLLSGRNYFAENNLFELIHKKNKQTKQTNKKNKQTNKQTKNPLAL